MHAPGFWQTGSWPARLLSPLSPLVARATARRVARPGWRAPVPVLCCGNAGTGGAGKTTLALDLAARLLARGERVACLTRGYRGRLRGPVAVTPAHTALDVGDEALLLAAAAPTVVGADRAAAARLAVAAGATVLVMDDGLQNAGLVQTLAFLVIDGGAGFGNGRVLPAGPLREPAAAAAARCRAAVLIGEDRHSAAAALPGLPILRAVLRPDAPGVTGQRVLAFAGIGRPAKFFATAAQAGAEIVAQQAFPDHHRYRPAELAQLHRRASQLGAALVTTAKDAARLPPDWRGRVGVIGVTLAWEDAASLESLLDTLR